KEPLLAGLLGQTGEEERDPGGAVGEVREAALHLVVAGRVGALAKRPAEACGTPEDLGDLVPVGAVGGAAGTGGDLPQDPLGEPGELRVPGPVAEHVEGDRPAADPGEQAAPGPLGGDFVQAGVHPAGPVPGRVQPALVAGG